MVDNGYEVEVIKVDGGILKNTKENERACDYMLVSKKEEKNAKVVSERNLSKVVCMIELKGTNREKEISHAYDQISQTIDRLPEKYINNQEYLVATIAGAQDKTLPSMITKEKRELCKKLSVKCKNKVKNIEKLVFYIQPNIRTKKACVNKKKKPFVIECHSKNGAYIPVPELLLEMIEL